MLPPHLRIGRREEIGTIGYALIASILLGLGSFPYRRYLFWWTWNSWWLLPAAVLYLAIQAGAGFLGVVLAEITNWHPTDIETLNGALYGAAGAALIRLRLEDFGFGEVQQGTTLLRVLVNRITDWMDGLAQHQIERYLDERDDREIVRLVQRVDRSYVRRNATPAQLRQFAKNVDAAIVELGSSDATRHDSGRETLRGILLEWYMRTHGTWRL